MERIDIQHSEKEVAPKIDPNDIAAQIEITIREFEKGRSTKKIAEKYGLDPELTEHIIRLYVTHPGVTVDGINYTTNTTKK